VIFRKYYACFLTKKTTTTLGLKNGLTKALFNKLIKLTLVKLK